MTGISVIKKVGPFNINAGNGPANGLFNIYCSINDKVTNWFDVETKDWLVNLPDKKMIEECCKMIGMEDISYIDWQDYICTDEDSNQYVKEISPTKFYVFEINELEDFSINMLVAEIDIEQIPKQALISSLASYGYYYDHINDRFIDGAGDVVENMIIAECCFEDRLFL